MADWLLEQFGYTHWALYGACAWWYAATGRPPGWKFR